MLYAEENARLDRVFKEVQGKELMPGLNIPVAPVFTKKEKKLTPKLNSKKQKLYIAQKGLCAYCDVHFESVEKATFDHIMPKSKGGTDRIENLALVCRRCNSLKGDLSSWSEAQSRVAAFYAFAANLHARGYLK